MVFQTSPNFTQTTHQVSLHIIDRFQGSTELAMIRDSWQGFEISRLKYLLSSVFSR